MINNLITIGQKHFDQGRNFSKPLIKYINTNKNLECINSFDKTYEKFKEIFLVFFFYLIIQKCFYLILIYIMNYVYLLFTQNFLN